MNYFGKRARVVGGRIVRDSSWTTSSISYKRLVAVAVVVSLLIITNPANELQQKALDIFDLLRRQSGTSREKQPSRLTWKKLLDTPISVTNYGIFTVEERHAKLTVLALSQSWSCSYFDEQTGSFCSSLAANLCHGKPLLHDPKNHSYTAHRTICYLLILFSLLTFCNFPESWWTEPLLGALRKTFGRAHFSPFSLGLDLVNASFNVYPALVRMEKIVPTLEQGAFASNLGLPAYIDFIFYVVVLVVVLGGGSNTLASHFSKQNCLGFDSTVAAAVGYSSAFSSQGNTILPPQTVLWVYLPFTAVLGGSSLAWILGGMFGVMLAQYHLDNQNLLLAIKQTILSAF